MTKALTEKRALALSLRSMGKSYSQIKNELGVSKSSLSLWLRHLPLPKERIRELRDQNEQRIEKFRNTMRQKREGRLKQVFSGEVHRLLPLTTRELWVAGLFLYWGEGGKTAPAVVSLSNSNPEMVKFFISWLVRAAEIPKDKIIIRLQIYSDMSFEYESIFWSEALDIPLSQFRKPYIKQTTLRGITFKGFGHGTCNVIVYNRDLWEKITMGIKCFHGSHLPGTH